MVCKYHLKNNIGFVVELDADYNVWHFFKKKDNGIPIDTSIVVPVMGVA